MSAEEPDSGSYTELPQTSLLINKPSSEVPNQSQHGISEDNRQSTRGQERTILTRTAGTEDLVLGPSKAAMLSVPPDKSLCHPGALGEKALGWMFIPSEKKKKEKAKPFGFLKNRNRRF